MKCAEFVDYLAIKRPERRQMLICGVNKSTGFYMAEKYNVVMVYNDQLC